MSKEGREASERKIEGYLAQVDEYIRARESEKATKSLRHAFNFAENYEGPNRKRYLGGIYKRSRLIGQNEPPDSKWDDVDWECGPLDIEEKVTPLMFVKDPPIGRLSLAVMGGIGFISGLFFLSSNITGNVVGNLTQNTSNWIGVIALVMGILGFYVWRRK